MKTINEKYRLKGDKVIWAVYIVFIIISLMWVFSSMGKTVYEKQGGNITLMLFKHFFLLLSGFALCYISHLINYVNYSRIAKSALYFSFILLIFTLLYGFVFKVIQYHYLTLILPWLLSSNVTEVPSRAFANASFTFFS